MSENMSLYNAFRNTPDNAKKAINEGKLKGKTDINPMFRIEQLTKQFGPCGIGWKVVPTRIEYLAVPQRDEVMCFVDINLYYKQDGQWSEPVFGTGGSMLVENFRSAGVKSNDDGYKMAYTDAISVACKLLGMSADVYWQAGESKYSRQEAPSQPVEAPSKPVEAPKPADKPEHPMTPKERVESLCKLLRITVAQFGELYAKLQADGKVPNKKTAELMPSEWQALIPLMQKAAKG